MGPIDERVLAALTRSSGIVAAALAVLALTLGFLFSARETGRRRRPAWWLDLHNRIGGLTVIAVGVHILASLADSTSGIRVVDAVVPGIAHTDRAALAWGVVATYLFVGAAFTTWPRRLRNRTLWRVVHLGSAVAAVLSLVHGFQMGTDAAGLASKVAVIAIAGPATYALGVRLFGFVLPRKTIGA